jgi:hypothetical protein
MLEQEVYSLGKMVKRSSDGMASLVAALFLQESTSRNSKVRKEGETRKNRDGTGVTTSGMYQMETWCRFGKR